MLPLLGVPRSRQAIPRRDTRQLLLMLGSACSVQGWMRMHFDGDDEGGSVVMWLKMSMRIAPCG